MHVNKDTLESFLESFSNDVPLKDFKLSEEGWLSEILSGISKKDYEGVIASIEVISRHEKLEHSHPLDNSITTRARFSKKIKLVNFIFFSDSKNQNWWAIAQQVCFIDCILVPGAVLKCFSLPPGLMETVARLPTLSGACKYPSYSKSKLDGFLLSYAGGPFHFFYDHLYPLWRIVRGAAEKGWRPSVLIDRASIYFDPRLLGIAAAESQNIEGKLLLYPCCIKRNARVSPNLGSRHDVMDVSRDQADVKVFEQHLLYSTIESHRRRIYFERPANLTLWIGISSGKRSLRNQVEVYTNILEEVSKEYGNIAVFIDGYTSTLDGGEYVGSDKEVCESIMRGARKFSTGIEFCSVVGWNYPEKIAACWQSDCFISNAGTGSFVPARVVGKPGVLHSNKSLFAFPDKYPDTIQMVDHDFITEERRMGDDPPPHKVSYSVPWKHVFDKLIEALMNSRKNENKKGERERKWE